MSKCGVWIRSVVFQRTTGAHSRYNCGVVMVVVRILFTLGTCQAACPKTSVQAASGSMSNAILSSTLFCAPLRLNTSFPGACTVLSLPFPQDVGRISASECCPHHDGLPSLWKHDANSLEGRLPVIDPGCLGFAAINSRGAAPGFTATVV